MTSEAAGAITSDVEQGSSAEPEPSTGPAPNLARRRRIARWVSGSVVAAAAIAAIFVGLKLRTDTRLRAENLARLEREAQQKAAARAVAAAPVPPVVTAESPPAAVEPPAPAEPASPPEPTPEAPSGSAVPSQPAPGPDLSSAFAAALTAKPGDVIVTVKVEPAGTILFDHGKRIGTDSVQVGVPSGGKKTLVALRDGYQPRRFAIDGTESTVTITLRPNYPGEGAPPVQNGSYGVGPAPASPPPPTAASPAPAAGKPATGKPSKDFDPSRDVGSL